MRTQHNLARYSLESVVVFGHGKDDMPYHPIPKNSRPRTGASSWRTIV